jgi:hypothetical protein
MTNNIIGLIQPCENELSARVFVQLAVANGFKTYQDVADRFNDSKKDIIEKWARGCEPTKITRIGLYAIAKIEGWL